MGTWACNGSHKWRAYSSGTDYYKHLHPHVPPKYSPPEGKVLGGVAGSNELYSFRGVRSQTSQVLPVTVEAKFIRCRCVACRNDSEDACPSKHEFGSWQQRTVRLRNQRKKGESGDRGRGRGRSRGRGRDDDDDDDDDDEDEDISCEKCASTDEGGGNATRKMLLCDLCDEGWHLYCLPVHKRLFETRV